MRRRAWLLIACAFSLNAWADGTFVQRTATTAELFGDESAQGLAQTLPVDQPVKFQLRLPDDTKPGNAAPSGVVVFIKPYDTGTFPENWAGAFDSRNLIWISADDSGNRTPTNKRILTAIMGVTLAGKVANVDPRRIYIAGLSGGGRVASQAITRYPEQFVGAICIVGADFFLPEEPARSLALERRLVFITGGHDFNRNDVRHVFSQYGMAGATHVKLLYIPHLGHEYPSDEDFGTALDYLDTR